MHKKYSYLVFSVIPPTNDVHRSFDPNKKLINIEYIFFKNLTS